MKFLFLLLLVFKFGESKSQDGFVTFVKGTVYHNGRIVHIKDRLFDTSALTSTDTKAEVGIFFLKKGRKLIRFDKGVIKSGKNLENNELYQVVIQDFVDDYITSKNMTHKGAFDFLDFFSDTSGAGATIRLLIVEGQGMPARSARLKFKDSDELSLCTISDIDTACHPLGLKNDSVYFSVAEVKRNGGHEQRAVPMLLKFSYLFRDERRKRYFPYKLDVSIRNKEQLSALIDCYAAGLQSYYKNDQTSMQADIDKELYFQFGRYYASFIHGLIAERLTTIH